MKPRRKVVLGVGLGVALLGSGVLALPRILFRDGVDYSAVASIQQTAEFHDGALLERAFAQPVAALYRKGGLDYQRNGSFCGPTSAVDLLRSLGTEAHQATILDGTGLKTAFGVLWSGLTLDQEAALIAKQSGRRVTVLRDLDLAALREHLGRANDPARRYVVNFHRGALFGRGGGHHSPIGGYLGDRDLVLVLDVNRQYGPWLVKTDRLLAAIDTVDRASGRKRGLLLVE